MDTQSQAALKGQRIGASTNSGPLIIVEGKKEGKTVVLQRITLLNGEKSAEPLAEGSTFTGTFAGVFVKPASNGFDEKRYLQIRANDDSLVRVAMGYSLTRDLEEAKEAGLEEGNAIQVRFNGVKATKSGRTVNSYSITI